MVLNKETAVELLAYLRGEEISAVDAEKKYREEGNRHMVAYVRGQKRVFAYVGDVVQALLDQENV